MKTIPLSQGKFAIVDDEDYEELNKHKWCAIKSRNVWYAYRWIQRPDKTINMIAMHRQILRTPKGLEVDHKNFNGLCNIKDNIRNCTTSQNQARQKPQGGTSIYKGVYWYKKRKKWRVRIVANKILYHLGCFDNEINAARAYDKKAVELFGEFALTNAELFRI